MGLLSFTKFDRCDLPVSKGARCVFSHDGSDIVVWVRGITVGNCVVNRYPNASAGLKTPQETTLESIGGNSKCSFGCPIYGRLEPRAKMDDFLGLTVGP